MSTVQFAGAGMVSAMVQSTSLRFAMPPVDANNPDTALVVSGAAAVFVRIGGNMGDPPLTCLPGQPGVIRVDPGTAMLLTSNPAIVAAGGSTRFINDGGGAAGATSFSVAAQMAGPTLTVQRGTAAAFVTF